MREVVAATPRGAVLRCRVAESGHDRRIGLRGARDLPLDTALLFPDATSVHTLGTRFPILVVRLDDTFTVVDVRRVRPGRLVPPMRRASHVLECNEDVDVRVGDVLRIEGPRPVSRRSRERARTPASRQPSRRRQPSERDAWPKPGEQLVRGGWSRVQRTPGTPATTASVQGIGSTSHDLKPDAELSRGSSATPSLYFGRCPRGRGWGRARSDPGPHRLAA